MTITKYICYRCNQHKTNKFNDMQKHICKKYSCIRNMNTICMSDDQLLLLSLIPYHDDKHDITMSELEHLSKSDIINKNRDELFNEILNIEKNKIRKCKYCDLEFEQIICLKKHIMVNCFHNYLCNKQLSNINSINISDNSNTNVNTYNTYNRDTYNNCDINNNNNNNINLYLNMKQPIPFEDNWDLSKINTQQNVAIVASKFMYSSLLEAILENEINNNVIMNSDMKSGMVYMNHDDKYIQMKSAIIAEKTMKKLHENMNSMHKSNKNYYMDTTFNHLRHNINDKNNDYLEDKVIKNSVNNLLCDIYHKHKNLSEKMANNVKLLELSNNNNDNNDDNNNDDNDNDNNNNNNNNSYMNKHMIAKNGY